MSWWRKQVEVKFLYITATKDIGIEDVVDMVHCCRRLRRLDVWMILKFFCEFEMCKAVIISFWLYHAMIMLATTYIVFQTVINILSLVIISCFSYAYIDLLTTVQRKGSFICFWLYLILLLDWFIQLCWPLLPFVLSFTSCSHCQAIFLCIVYFVDDSTNKSDHWFWIVPCF